MRHYLTRKSRWVKLLTRFMTEFKISLHSETTKVWPNCWCSRYCCIFVEFQKVLRFKQIILVLIILIEKIVNFILIELGWTWWTKTLHCKFMTLFFIHFSISWILIKYHPEYSFSFRIDFSINNNLSLWLGWNRFFADS